MTTFNFFESQLVGVAQFHLTNYMLVIRDLNICKRCVESRWFALVVTSTTHTQHNVSTSTIYWGPCLCLSELKVGKDNTKLERVVRLSDVDLITEKGVELQGSRA